METNVVEIILRIMSHLQAGERLTDMKQEELSAYNSAEVGAAYSWLYSRFPELLNQGVIAKKTYIDPKHRVLHLAEKVLISREAYGYLLRLVYLGLIDVAFMEKVIERVMLQFHERLTLDKLQEIVAELLFQSDAAKPPGKPGFLNGSEKIH